MSTTVVWVHLDLLDKGAEKSHGPTATKAASMDDPTSPQPGLFKWILCDLVGGTVSNASGPHTVRVLQENSEYHGQTITVDTACLRKGDDFNGILVANEFEVEWLKGGSSHLPPDDLTALTHLHEASLVFSLQQRYIQNTIYTATGPILIALNPFKAIPGLYNSDVMNKYSEIADDSDLTTNLQPHIYKKAHDAFRSMMQGLDMYMSGIEGAIVSQSILVSGESGAGKTVTTKHVMNYLASLSQRKAESMKRRRCASPGRSEPRVPNRRMSSMRSSRAVSWKAGALVEERILESNPILEAFGNARTSRNDNSSRFGKLIELQFKKTGSLVGASIETYLLEKVRLVHQSEGERNYHVFYALLKGAFEEEQEKYLLSNFTVNDFKMTSASGTFDRRDGVDDEDFYQELVVAMSTMGFSHQTVDDIFACIAGFLHGFNLTFTAPTDESSMLDDSNCHLEAFLKLLGLNQQDVNSAMTEYDLQIGNQTFTRQLTIDGAQKALEAFVKGTYGALFSFIVTNINERIECKTNEVIRKSLGKAAAINVLDIFGFESFTTNSFEQLCINYCNESLQQQFNFTVFKNEQVDYQLEGIAFDVIDFPDNSQVIELIEQNGSGILSILTDQCRQPRTTDRTFVEALYKTCENHSRFVSSPLRRGKGQFAISHYAGVVVYDSDGFLEKNKDEVPRGASNLLESSKKSFVRHLGCIIKRAAEATKNVSSSRAAKKRPTVGTQFSSQLANLRARIGQTKPHYIKCLKPNQSLKPDEFDSTMVADQLQYAGVLEAIRVSRVGYAQRYTHSDFIDRYRCIVMERMCDVPKDEKLDILLNGIIGIVQQETLLASPISNDTISETDIQKGTTKIFLRQNAFEYLESLRADVLFGSAVKMQSLGRSFIARRRSHRRRDMVIASQAYARRYLATKTATMLKQEYASKQLALESSSADTSAREAAIDMDTTQDDFLVSLAELKSVKEIIMSTLANSRKHKSLWEKLGLRASDSNVDHEQETFSHFPELDDIRRDFFQLRMQGKKTREELQILIDCLAIIQ